MTVPYTAYQPAITSRSRAAVLVAIVIPALTLAYPLLIWPLLYAAPIDRVSSLAPPVAELASQPLNRLWFPPLLLLALAAFLGSRRAVPREYLGPLAALGALAVLALVSAAWALDPLLSLKRLVMQVCIAGSVLFSVLALDRPRSALEPIFWLFAGVIAINVAVVVSTPPGPIGHEGIYAQKNTLGAVAAMAIIFFGWRTSTGGLVGRFAALIGIACCLFLLIESQSKTSAALVVLVPILTLAIAVFCHPLRMAGGLVVVASAILFWIMWTVYAANTGTSAQEVFGAVTGDPTLTGRTEIWAFSADYVRNAPLLGYGFQSFWNIGPASPNLAEAPSFIAKMPNSHNGYVDMALQLGFAGLAIFLLLVFALANETGRLLRQDTRLGALMIALLVFCILHNFLETQWFEGFAAGGILFMLVLSIGPSTTGTSAGLYGIHSALPGDGLRSASDR